jgi:hypothetical protein
MEAAALLHEQVHPLLGRAEESTSGSMSSLKVAKIMPAYSSTRS